VVRLGGGLTADKRIDRGTQARALEALAKFAERLRGFPRTAVRAVGTNARRVAKNSPQFLREARAALGFPIEVISGREEARLIYLGVAHALPVSSQRRLVVDIGGGSTEFIIGTGFDPQLTESLYMGCLSYSLKYFPDGKVDKPRMKAAELAGQELRTDAARRETDGLQHGTTLGTLCCVFVTVCGNNIVMRIGQAGNRNRRSDAKGLIAQAVLRT
jgi:exopolyphosphatase/guanosine-5'-triphosphate,3'-diphosphate pyrophosphatase